jgi:hypothetical protein
MIYDVEGSNNVDLLVSGFGQMYLTVVGTRFSIGLLMQPGNRAGQLDPSCPARFPDCISSPMEKRVPTKTILEVVDSWWFPALRLRFCARALRASGLTWLWPRMALAVLTMCA